MFFRGKSSLKYRSAYWDPRFKHGHTCSKLCTAIDYGQVSLFLSTFFALELSKGDPECESVSEAHYRRVRLHVVEILSDAYISVFGSVGSLIASRHGRWLSEVWWCTGVRCTSLLSSLGLLLSAILCRRPHISGKVDDHLSTQLSSYRNLERGRRTPCVSTYVLVLHKQFSVIDFRICGVTALARKISYEQGIRWFQFV